MLKQCQPRRSTLPGLAVLASALLCLGGAAIAADAKNPYTQANDTWITLSGTVKDVMADRFTLDYGKGLVTVEMDDGDRDADAYKLIEGDKVTVEGRIDDDFYEKTKIEAGSVYVEKLGTYFHSSAIDEEDFRFGSIASPVIVSTTIVHGTVTEVNGRTFTIDTGERRLQVDTAQMPYDPLDDLGYLKIEEGDYVKVNGKIDDDFFGGREFVADSVVKLAG